MKNNKWENHTQLFVFLGSFFSLLSIVVVILHIFPEILKTEAKIQQIQTVKPSEEIEINFSFPVLQSEISKRLTIFPATKFSAVWQDGRQKLKIIPENLWEPQTDYKISISGGRNIFYFKFDQELFFSTQPYPKIKKIFPIDGEKDVAVDIEEPIAVDFDYPLDEYNVKFEVKPAVKLEYQVSAEKNNIRLLAKDNFAWETRYDIGIFVKHKKQVPDRYFKVGQTSFETAAIPPTKWDKDPAVLLDQAKKYTKAAVLVGKYIDINLSQQVMVIFENGKPLDAFRISSGKKGMETPTGTFKIENKTLRAWSKKYALFMPNWMAITPSGEIGIHELPVWPGGFQEGANHLGIPVSHGCVRLGPGPAKIVFNWAEVGTPVVVHK